MTALEHAPMSTDWEGRYGAVSPVPLAGLPGCSAKLVLSGFAVSVPVDSVPTFTQSGFVLHWFDVQEKLSPLNMALQP